MVDLPYQVIIYLFIDAIVKWNNLGKEHFVQNEAAFMSHVSLHIEECLSTPSEFHLASSSFCLFTELFRWEAVSTGKDAMDRVQSRAGERH